MVSHKTTVYLPGELKTALERAAAVSRRSESERIREGIRRVTAEYASPEPRLPLFFSGRPGLARNVDEALKGFGET